MIDTLHFSVARQRVTALAHGARADAPVQPYRPDASSQARRDRARHRGAAVLRRAADRLERINLDRPAPASR